MADNRTLVVTRHAAYVEYLRETGIIQEDFEVKEHVGPRDVAGRYVIGILPLHLAALAETVTTVPLFLPQELRSVELSLEQVRQYSGPATTYRVFTSDQFSRALATVAEWAQADGCSAFINWDAAFEKEKGHP